MDSDSILHSADVMNSKAFRRTLSLVFQSLGVVYGDLTTSPIYVFTSTFSGRLKLHENDDDIILGVLSLIFWTLTLIPLCKYILFVLGANDNGEGGTFALYSLLCRNSKMGLLNTSYATCDELLTYNAGSSPKDTRGSLALRNFFHRHHSSRLVLLLFVLLGTSMVISDGVLTPAMSVLSAVSGMEVKFPNLHENYAVFIACAILVGVFALQKYGTHRVGFLFAPIMIMWLLCISSVGIYNIFRWNAKILYALSPYHVYNFFEKAGKDGWRSLGGIALCVTGAEAMFADLGHFSLISIRVSFAAFVYPCLIFAYMGEAAYLSVHKSDLHRSFYRAIPEHLFWPIFIIATAATVVGSQAVISATFSVISQCRALKCFPRVKILHTSNYIHGQIYIPEVNWLLMVMCVAVVIGFRDTHLIGNAYGLAVITVMLVTTCLMFLVIVMVWKRTILLALFFVATFGSVEVLYLSACFAKVPRGGWVPLLLSILVLLVKYVWHYGTSKKEAFEAQNKVCIDKLLSLSPGLGIVRVPGIGLIYTSSLTGIPPMFAHFVTNFPAFHKVLIFVSMQSVAVPRISAASRFQIGRIGPPEFRIYRCVVKYGYKDIRRESYEFENQLIMKVAEFLQQEGEQDDDPSNLSAISSHSGSVVDAQGSRCVGRKKKVSFKGVEVNDEVKELVEAREAGLAYMMGQTCVVACENSSLTKKWAINMVYSFLRQNCRRPSVALGVPHTSLIEVGMVYHV